jgi:hypothetical protein
MVNDAGLRLVSNWQTEASTPSPVRPQMNSSMEAKWWSRTCTPDMTVSHLLPADEIGIAIAAV